MWHRLLEGMWEQSHCCILRLFLLEAFWIGNKTVFGQYAIERLLEFRRI